MPLLVFSETVPPRDTGPLEPVLTPSELEVPELTRARQELAGLRQELRLQDAELGDRARQLQQARDELAAGMSYREFFDTAPVGFFTMDQTGRILWSNRSGASMLSKSCRELEGTPLAGNIPVAERANLARHVALVFAGQSASLQVTLVKSDGGTVPVSLRSSPMPDKRQGGYLCQTVAIDVSEHKATEAQLVEAKTYLEHLAHHDPLTGLPNRALFQDRLKSATTRARRSGKHLALMLMDLDRFKIINDSLGHHAGDRLLCEISSRLRKSVREVDTVARLGGDEFAIILENIEHLNDVSIVAQKVADTLAEPVTLGTHQVRPTTSVGICLYPSDTIDPDEMVRNADAAMYRSKSLGRNTFQFFTPELNAELSKRLSIESDLHAALERGEFELDFQPQYHVTERKVVALEALVRWRHPSRGLLGPDQFIGIAEETGIIEPLGDWVLKEACKELTKLRGYGLADLRVAVNISARQLKQASFSERVRRILRDARTPPSALEIEVTESALFEDIDAALETLRALRDFGVGIAIDDFGTGYSSLSRLRSLPLSRLKIDASFVRGIPSSQDDRSIALAIISMAHDLGLEVVSEGVENHEQRAFLERSGCDLLQGFFVGRPVNATALAKVLANP